MTSSQAIDMDEPAEIELAILTARGQRRRILRAVSSVSQQKFLSRTTPP
jgi:hypothetical protein